MPTGRRWDAAFDGRVRVFDVADFTHIRPHDLRDRCCLVVGTIQTLRVSNTEGRKVYAHNEEMEPHFAALPQSAPGLELERLENGAVKFSFANLLHLHRPLMIVDEAHNAVTGLTRDMQARVNPCAIIEFTATPRRQVEHPAQRQRPGTQARRHDQAAHPACRARFLAERGEWRHRRACFAGRNRAETTPTISGPLSCSRRSRKTRRCRWRR